MLFPFTLFDNGVGKTTLSSAKPVLIYVVNIKTKIFIVPAGLGDARYNVYVYIYWIHGGG